MNEPRKRVRIESDGTPAGTRVLVDGVELAGVVSVTWSVEVGGTAFAMIRVRNVEVAVEAEETSRE